MESCYCCGELVSEGEEKKRRRALGTPNSQPFLETLTSFIVNRVKNAMVDLTQLHTGYLCRSCNNMIVNLHKKVDAKLAVAISILPKRAKGGSGSSRASSNASQSAAAARVHPLMVSDSSTPPVAVSAFHKKMYILTDYAFLSNYRQLFIIVPEQDHFPLHLTEGVYAGPLLKKIMIPLLQNV